MFSLVWIAITWLCYLIHNHPKAKLNYFQHCLDCVWLSVKQAQRWQHKDLLYLTTIVHIFHILSQPLSYTHKYIYSFTSAQILWSFKSQFCILSTLLQPPSHVRASFPSSCSCIPILTFSVTPNTPKIRWEVPFNFSPPLIGTSLCYMITGCQD